MPCHPNLETYLHTYSRFKMHEVVTRCVALRREFTRSLGETGFDDGIGCRGDGDADLGPTSSGVCITSLRGKSPS